MSATRAEVVAAARGWLGTPFAHQQRLKGVAVDCAGLVIGVARELGLVAADFDINGYGRQPDGRSMLRWCREHMRQIDEATLQPGDVIVITWDARPQHLGIVGDYPHGVGQVSIIHALEHAMVHKVVEHRLLLHPNMRLAGAFALPGVA